MDDQKILKWTILFTLGIEFVLIILCLYQVGEERLPTQLMRVAIQLLFIFILFYLHDRLGKFLLTAYHVFTCVFIFSTPGHGMKELGFGFYHLIAATIIYFNDWIEMKIWPTESK